jgi:acyl dehydratase
MTSLYLEDFTTGQTFKSSGRTITEADLTIFSMVSGDWNPIHADAEFARGTRYGQRVVHGVLGIAIAIGKLHEMGIFEHSAVAMLGLKEWNFLAPVLVGDTLHLELTITSVVRGKSGRSGQLGRRFRMFNQKGEVVQEGESTLLILTREGAGHPAP